MKPESAPSAGFRQVEKRDGRLVPFDAGRITRAITLAMQAAGEGVPADEARLVADAVIAELGRRYRPDHVPKVEEIQDVVEESLILLDFPKTAKAYILYRNERARIRSQARRVPSELRLLFAGNRRYFPNPLSELVYFRTYSRWSDVKGRRETWPETVGRYLAFMREILGGRLSSREYDELRAAILEQRVLPSMRLLWSAGKAARASNVAAYNCAFIAPRSIDDLAEIMYLLMCGTGVGFSVETQNVQHLPIIERQRGEKPPVHAIDDSREGWCDALKTGLRAWYTGRDLAFDFSRLRPAGARLRTMGGRSSGPEPLRILLAHCRSIVLRNQGKRLRNIDVHDLVCRIGETVSMGGVRRSALISLSDLDDLELRWAKSGAFYLSHPERSFANNSAVYLERPAATDFLDEWLALARAGTGERGLFNRGALPVQLPRRRWPTFEKDFATSGTNPCGEVILRSKQFCNLTEVVARPDDTERTLLDKITLATILGTYQCLLTDFPYLSADWRSKCEEERLLGVSITGQWDSPASRDPVTLARLKARAIEVNQAYAARFGVSASAAVTCVKPSGTVSQLVNAASGLHPRFARHYLRRVRIAATDPILELLRDQKFPFLPEVGQDFARATTYVLEFPVASPPDAIVRDDLKALAQLEYWKTLKLSFTEHNPSVTISVRRDEWIETADWLYRNWEQLGGLSFLPRDETIYQLAPYETISGDEYARRVAALPAIDFSRIVLYESDDQTSGAGEPACQGGFCELDAGESA